MTHVRYWNTNWIAGPTDFDQDGKMDFVVMSMSFGRGGDFFDWFESTGDNQFENVYSDSLPADIWANASTLKIFDIDNDGIDELVVCTSYWIGVYKPAGDNILEPIYLWDYASSEAPVYDTNNNGYCELVLDQIQEYTPGRDLFGDANGDCQITMLDVSYLVNYFKGEHHYLPRDRYLVDVNGNCQVNGIDVTYFINFFKGGPGLIRQDCR